MTSGQSGETKPHILIKKDAVKFGIIELKGEAQKYWLLIEFETDEAIYGWIPRLEHQWHLAKGIAICEDYKYQYGDGRIYPAKFLIDAMLPGTSLNDEIANEYNFARDESIRGIKIEGIEEICDAIEERSREEVASALIRHLVKRMEEDETPT